MAQDNNPYIVTADKNDEYIISIAVSINPVAVEKYFEVDDVRFYCNFNTGRNYYDTERRCFFLRDDIYTLVHNIAFKDYKECNGEFKKLITEMPISGYRSEEEYIEMVDKEEADEISTQILEYLNSSTKVNLKIKKPKIKNECTRSCGLCYTKCEGHGWYEYICLMSKSLAPLGRECGYSDEEKGRYREKMNWLI